MSSKKLENLLEKAVKDPAYRPEFFSELMKSDLIVLYQPDDNNHLRSESGHIKQETPIKIKGFKTEDGRSIIPIFSSIEALQKGIKTDEPYVQLNAKILFEISRGESYILNPYSNYAKEFVPEEINELLNDKASQAYIHTMKKDTKLLVGQPKEYPDSLVKALRKYFSKINLIQSAYLVQIFERGEDKFPHLLVLICMPNHNESIIRNAIIVSKDFIKKGDLIDFMIIKENDELINGVRPFFKNTFLNKVKNIVMKMIDKLCT